MESQHKSQLKSIVLNLRHILEGRYDDAGVWHPGDLEEQLAALGVRHDREAMPLEQLSHLSEDDRRARQMMEAFIQSNLKSDPAREEAIHGFLQESFLLPPFAAYSVSSEQYNHNSLRIFKTGHFKEGGRPSK